MSQVKLTSDKMNTANIVEFNTTAIKIFRTADGSFIKRGDGCILIADARLGNPEESDYDILYEGLETPEIVERYFGAIFLTAHYEFEKIEDIV